MITPNTYSEGENIEDNVFILLYSEVEKYYPITEARDIVERTCTLRNGDTRYWWLRTPDEESGIDSTKVAQITQDGSVTIMYFGYASGPATYVDDSSPYDYGKYDDTVRLAIYLKIQG